MNAPVVVDEETAAQARSLVDLCPRILADIETAYGRAGVELPARRYWLMGSPVVDCEQLTLSVVQLYLGPPGDEAATPQRCDAPRTVVLQVQVHRCAPVASKTGRPPTPEAIAAAAASLSTDALLLLDAAAGLDQWDPLGPGLGVIATVEVIDQQGDFHGVALNLTLAIP